MDHGSLKKRRNSINENRAKVEEFKKKTSLGIVKTKENTFLDINLKKKQEQKYSNPMTQKIMRMTTTKYQKIGEDDK